MTLATETRELIIEAIERVEEARKIADWETEKALAVALGSLALAQYLATKREEWSLS